MNIVIVTDAAPPQINGVVTTLCKTVECLRSIGHQVTMIDPGLFRTVVMPGYHDIKLSVNVWNLPRILEPLINNNTCLHIATEGPLGIAAKLWCDLRGFRYTTAYHTRFPEYIEHRYHRGRKAAYRFMRWFHGNSQAVMVNTHSMKNLLEQNGFGKLVLWGRGVDCNLFHSQGSMALELKDLSRPIWLNVGRVSVEKNLEDFYQLHHKLHGTFVQVGDGPDLEQYQELYPQVLFVGAKKGQELASYYRSADCFVFPSKTDTFGLVMLESMASGVPVAAYPAPGPLDVITQDITGVVSNNLEQSCLRALDISNKQEIENWAQQQSWQSATAQFFSYLTPVRSYTNT